ncbi:MAG: VCBS repeat-containing protein [Phycisphaerales bacterium]|nr:VCBS repeat-containing protein [Planctomycetota bacterium]MCH8508018.1 VCBS repeat-containing protein [Phycisphaerales bacterium]
MRFFLWTVASIVILACLPKAAVAQVGSLIQVVPVPPQPVPSPTYAIGELSASHPGKEVVVSDWSANTLRILSISGGNPVEIGSIATHRPRAASIEDIDGDGLNDLVILADNGNRLEVYLQSPQGNLVFTLENVINLPYRCDMVAMDAFCMSGFAQVLVRAESSDKIGVVLEPLLDDDLLTLSEEFDLECPEALVDSCDSRYETSINGDCETTPADPGIYACMLAADCRLGDCKWAACVLRAAGEYSFLRFAAARLACAAVFDLEMVLCLGSITIAGD